MLGFFFIVLLLLGCGFVGCCFFWGGGFGGEEKGCIRGVNMYGLRVSLTDFCDLDGLTGVRCNPYGYLWFLQIQTYNHSTLYIRTAVSLQWHQICFVSTKLNDLWYNKLCFVCLLYMGVLQRDPIPKLCFAMVFTICKDFFADCKDFLSWSYR